jgi:hypothetical protein
MKMHELFLMADRLDGLAHGGDYEGSGMGRSKQADQKIKMAMTREQAVQIAIELRCIANARRDHQSRRHDEKQWAEDQQLIKSGPPS